jgi:NAD(P)-dependent dehydrogenase (short-subunit alcohol dehydrogenase family)
VITLTKVMACELAPQKIRVKAIAPGPVEKTTIHALQTRQDARRMDQRSARGGATHRRTRFRVLRCFCSTFCCGLLRYHRI